MHSQAGLFSSILIFKEVHSVSISSCLLFLMQNCRTRQSTRHTETRQFLGAKSRVGNVHVWMFGRIGVFSVLVSRVSRAPRRVALLSPTPCAGPVRTFHMPTLMSSGFGVYSGLCLLAESPRNHITPWRHATILRFPVLPLLHSRRLNPAAVDRKCSAKLKQHYKLHVCTSKCLKLLRLSWVVVRIQCIEHYGSRQWSKWHPLFSRKKQKHDQREELLSKHLGPEVQKACPDASTDRLLSLNSQLTFKYVSLVCCQLLNHHFVDSCWLCASCGLNETT